MHVDRYYFSEAMLKIFWHSSHFLKLTLVLHLINTNIFPLLYIPLLGDAFLW